MSHRKLHSDVLEDLHGTAEGVAQFIEQGVWDDVVERSWTQDLDGLAQLLDPSAHRWRSTSPGPGAQTTHRPRAEKKRGQ